jgi:hypothetical protein
MATSGDGRLLGLLELSDLREGLLLALDRAVPSDWVSINEIGPTLADMHPVRRGRCSPRARRLQAREQQPRRRRSHCRLRTEPATRSTQRARPQPSGITPEIADRRAPATACWTPARHRQRPPVGPEGRWLSGGRSPARYWAVADV